MTVIGDAFRRIGIATVAGMTLAAAGDHASASQVRVVDSVDGWTIKSRTNAEGNFLACSMERFFVANKGEGKFRINIIAWPASVIVLLRGNDGFLEGEGVARFEIVSNERELFSGKIRYKESELLFALNGRDSRQDVARSSGWSVSMNGKRVARFPMNGSAAAMLAVERCAGLKQQVAEAPPPDDDNDLLQAMEAEGADPLSDSSSNWETANVEPATSGSFEPTAAVATEKQLQIMARNFSLEIDRPDFRMIGYQDGVLQWSYGDGITSGAATVTLQPKAATAYAGSLAIRPDQCGDSVLTLPMMVRDIRGGKHATVVSMCRGKSSVAVRHVHVATLGRMTTDGHATTYVLNYETKANPDGTGMPQSSDELASAFHAALVAAVGG